MSDTLQIIQRLRAGDRAAHSELYELVHTELRERAGRLMHNQRAEHTLQPTALVNEAWLKLAGGSNPNWEDRVHFLRAATRAMQSVLVDHARAKLAVKRGQEPARVELTHEPQDKRCSSWRVLALDEAMGRLEAIDAAEAQVAQLRVFGGLSHPEIAQLLGSSQRSIERLWRSAREWLQRELSDGD